MSTVSGGRRRAFRSRHHTPMGKGGKLAVIFVTLALLLFVFAVMLGNYLRGLAEDIIEDTTVPSSTESEVYYANPPENVIARGILFGKDYSAVDETEAETADETSVETDSEVIEEDPVKFDSVSVSLRKKDRDSGEMLLAYSSGVSLEYSIDVVGTCDLYEGLGLIKENWGERTKVCGIFEVDYPNRSEETRGIMRAYEIALICELVDAGFDEIMLIGFSGDSEEGLSFISDIYEQKGRGTAIGIAFSFDFLISEEAKDTVDSVAKKCGFLALDLSSAEVPVLMSAESLISDRVSRTLDICREYSIRVLLGCGSAPDTESQTRAAMSTGAKNIMTALGIERE
ncbi:MAG: hypothetical protein J6S71_01575 [Clostridia bacterium]|nr:hypothetical protein [Clostridia bacterium]